MIFFLGGSEIFIIIVVVLALLTGAVEFVSKMTAFLFILFLVKNFIQTVVIGFFKNHVPLKNMLFYLGIDVIRVCSFFYFFTNWIDIYFSASGLTRLLYLLILLFFTILSGSAFIIGEIVSYTHATKTGSDNQSIFLDIILVIGIFVVGWISTL